MDLDFYGYSRIPEPNPLTLDELLEEQVFELPEEVDLKDDYEGF